MYRLVDAGWITMTEAYTVLSLAEVLDMNDALTAKQVAERAR